MVRFLLEDWGIVQLGVKSLGSLGQYTNVGCNVGVLGNWGKLDSIILKPGLSVKSGYRAEGAL